MRGGFFVGLAVGIGGALIAPAYWRSGRPLAKKALRAGVEGYVVARRTTARFTEEIEDLIAEVTHEMHEAAAEAAQSGDNVIRAGGAGTERP